jgi:hypothetical protein
MGYDLHVVDTTGEVVPTNYEDDLYFRRNIYGMGPLRDAMASIGVSEAATMGYWPISEPDWPSRAEATEEDVEDFLKALRDERPGISMHKLCSNDGWWVTAMECRTALDIWEQAGMPMHEEFRDDWIPFLQQAAKHGGFRTY